MALPRTTQYKIQGLGQMLIVLLFHSEISSTCQLRIFTEMDADLDEVLLDGPWRSQHGYFSLPAVRARDQRRVKFDCSEIVLFCMEL